MNKSYLKIKTHYNFDKPDKYKYEYRQMIIHYLETELMNIEETKRPLAYYKEKLYVRKPTENENNEPCYKWFLTDIKEFIEEIQERMHIFSSKLEYATDTEVAMTYFMNTQLTETDHKKIISDIKSYILIK